MPHSEETQVECRLLCQRNDANMRLNPNFFFFFLSTSEFLPSALVQYLISDKENSAQTQSLPVNNTFDVWYVIYCQNICQNPTI